MVDRLLSVASIMRYPAETTKYREGKGPTVRNVYNPSRDVMLSFSSYGLMSEPETAMGRMARLSTSGLLKAAHAVLTGDDRLDN
jgi:hypothetical protein